MDQNLPSIFNEYETDNELARGGVWIEIINQGRLVGRFKCRPADGDLNPDYRRAMLELADNAQQILKDDKFDELDDDSGVRMHAKVYAKAVVVDWKLTGPDGQPLEFSEAACVDLFVRLPKLFKVVQRHARRWTSFKLQREGESLKD